MHHCLLHKMQTKRDEWMMGLSEVLNEEQKIDKIHNLISSLTGKSIRNIGSRRASKWVLIKGPKQ